MALISCESALAVISIYGHVAGFLLFSRSQVVSLTYTTQNILNRSESLFSLVCVKYKVKLEVKKNFFFQCSGENRALLLLLYRILVNTKAIRLRFTLETLLSHRTEDVAQTWLLILHLFDTDSLKTKTTVWDSDRQTLHIATHREFNLCVITNVWNKKSQI